MKPYLRRSLVPFALTFAVTAVATPDLAAQSAGELEPVSEFNIAGDAQAQVVSGAVFDSSGAAISGAIVTLKVGTSQYRTTTGAAGRFVFEDVAAGPGTLTVSFERFAPVTLNLIGPRRDVRVVLEPVPVSESVTVRAPEPTSRRITSGTRTDTPLRDVPQSVSVITRRLIADQAMGSMADVVRFVPGLGMAQGEGHRDAPIFRGSTSTSDFFVDGIRDDTQYLRDVYNLERVEVLKGPNGTIFGRGGVGGVINRVTRQADWARAREISVQGGSWDNRRLSTDFGGPLNGDVAARLTGLYENSGSYRNAVNVERYGVNPTIAFAIGPKTTVRAGYEFFHDERTTDRGIPSFQGSPLDVHPSAFFGSTDFNRARITVNMMSSGLEHTFRDGVTLHNRLSYADYDKFYENLVPGAVNAARTMVALTGYNSTTDRQNLFNQTDLVIRQRTGRVQHTILTGVEVGRQETGNLRLTAFFPSVSPTATSISVPLSNPTTSEPVEFRAADGADNHGVATVAAFYAQDQIALSPRLEAVVGLRFDRFNIELLDRRTRTELDANDGLVSPRLALIYKPLTPVSLYASYTRSHLPRAGEQLASLSPSNQALDPETYRNFEVGAKWDIRPILSFTTAVYRLDHGNVVVRDPLNPTVSHLVDAERSAGLETEVTGLLTDRWTIHGGYAYQQAEITRSLSATVVDGARLGQVPAHKVSLWSKYELSRMWAAGLGIISQSDSFVATDNTVVLPGFTRVDAAVFVTPIPRLRIQANLENVFNERYYASAHSNNNITPGSPRALRLALTTRF
jgi:catecholate siderophore receptor